jgi:poly-beta-1,6-N-acetyl-D-glucosamine biosynthesis protein PgaD
MNSYIINNPKLQSLRKRINGLIVWALCWLMWIYLLLPLLTLSGWLLGDKKLATEMRWFGGYKSLLQLLEIYLITLLVIVVLWLGWVLYHALRPQKLIAAASKTVNDQELCDFYQVKRGELLPCRDSPFVTVYFNDQGEITQLAPSVPQQQQEANRSAS